MCHTPCVSISLSLTHTHTHSHAHSYLFYCTESTTILYKCNCGRKEFERSKRFKGIEEVNEKKLTYAEAIHVDEVDKNHCNWDSLWGIDHTLLSDIVEENENAAKECIDEDVHDVKVDAKACCT